MFFDYFLRACPLRGRARFAGAPPSGVAGPGPPPVCRVEILKKFTGKSVPDNYIFWKKQVFPLKTL